MRTRTVLVLAFLLLAICISSAWSAPTPAPKAKPTHKPMASKTVSIYQESAPADEYFGKMKLSFLGINNTFRDQAIRAGDHTTNPTVTGPVTWAEDAMRAWAAKYGRDPQLARSYYLAFLVDRKIWLADFQERATTYLMLLSSKFPATYFGKQAKADLSKGMTLNFYLQPMPCDTAAAAAMQPAPVVTADPKHNIKVNPIPVPCSANTPTPTPAPLLPIGSPAPGTSEPPPLLPVPSPH